MGDPSDRADAIGATSRYLTRGGRPWLPVMGEFHYSRYPAAEWREELAKVRAGGVTMVATYVFWIYHEEERGVVDWSGDRDLRRFVTECADVGLDVVVRIGPWGHGECRNGGFPDWVQHAGLRTRTDDPAYLAIVRPWFAQIAAQLTGLDRAWGGPIVGIQLENELYDQPDHLLTLKRLAREVGLDAPLWTATGWGHAQLPPDEVLPLFGGYSEAAWDSAHDGWPQQARAHYFFGPGRDDDSIGADLRTTPSPVDGDEAHLMRYPFATCELGGGMYTSYHRRPVVEPDDIAALALVKLGSGSAWQGYYMYHGGSMKIGRRSTLQESHATGYPNDCPLVTYDFQAPLGEYGQFRESWARLRMQHLWLADHGAALAPMTLSMPDDAPTDTADRSTLRWAVRSDGHCGYLFVNNHQPVETLPDHHDVQFGVALAGREIVVPAQPVTVASGAYFVWPLRRPIGEVTLVSATAQPVCDIVVDGVPTAVLVQTGGIGVELTFDGEEIGSVDGTGTAVHDGQDVRVTGLQPGTGCRVRVTSRTGGVADILILDERSARQLTRGRCWGTDRLVVSAAPALVTDDGVVVYTPPADAEILLYPPLSPADTTDGLFGRYAIGGRQAAPVPAQVRSLSPAGPAREPVIDPVSGNASAPTDDNFAAAAVYEVPIPPEVLDHADETLLRVDWTGDVGRAYIGDTLVADHFWYGSTWEIGLRRFRDLLRDQPLRLHLLPLRRDAPVYLSPQVRPTDHVAGQVLQLRSASFVPVSRVTVKPAAR
ncbi:beta-galactosidase [Plantactinospora sp. CA-294935]|uniref:beta-galactosidase n=1 Tax=Plantactinospora sp. CA-294935 TaxID=3240012 RepID=UPI003D8F80A5